MERAPDAPGVKECCKTPGNLSTVDAGPDRTVSTCGVCGCRHFRLKVDPMKLGIRGGTMGRGPAE